MELDDASAAVLRDLVAAAVRDLHYEIAGTDNPEYRRGLRERVEILEAILSQFPAVA
jgi:hypothetical protein